MSAAPVPAVTIVSGVQTYSVTNTLVGVFQLTDAFGDCYSIANGATLVASLTGGQFADVQRTLGAANVALVAGPPATSGAGTVTLNGTTPVTVVAAGVTASSVVVFTLKAVGGTVGATPHVETITAGTGFTVEGTAGDTSVYNYLILN